MNKLNKPKHLINKNKQNKIKQTIDIFNSFNFI